MRDGDLKLLCNYDGSNPQLYNLIDDSAENNNLASQYPELTQKMTERLKSWNSTLPKDNGNAPTRLNKKKKKK